MPSFITRIRKISPDRFTIFIATLAIMGAGIVLLRGLYNGPIITNDSIIYISTARNLIAGEGLTRWNDLPFDASYPPAFPVLLAISTLLIFDPIDIVLPFNAAAFGLAVFLAGRWLHGQVEKSFLTVWGCISLSLSLTLASTASIALSETLFILFITLSLIQADKYLREGRYSSLIWTAVFTAMACTTRYIGVAVILAVVTLLLAQSNATPREKAKRVTIYLALSTIPLGLWVLRNYIVWGDISRHLPVPDNELPDNIYTTLSIISEWVAIVPLDGFYSTVAVGLTGTVMAVLTAFAFYSIIKRWRKGFAPDDRPIMTALAFSIAYIGFTVFMWTVLGSTTINERYIAPGYIPVLLTVVILMERFLNWTEYRNHRRSVADASKIQEPDKTVPNAQRETVALNPISQISRSAISACEIVMTRHMPKILYAALTVWTCYAAYNIALNTYSAMSEDSTVWTSRQWRESPTIKYMQSHLSGGLIFSTAPFLTYIHSDNQTQHRWLPRRTVEESFFEGFSALGYTRWLKRESLEALPQWIEQQEDSSEERHVVVIHGAPHPVDATDLRVLPGLEPVAEFDDGIIFRINKGYTPDIDSYRSDYETVTSRQPTVDTQFALYLNGDRLTYIKEECTDADTDQPFILHIIPKDLRDLTEEGSRQGYNTLDFTFDQYGVRFDGKCMATVSMPQYLIDSIRTGPLESDGEIAWQIAFPFNGDAYHANYEAITSEEPEAQSTFDLYLNQNTLTYAKKPCAFTDTQLRFFLHVFPTDANDLPDERVRYGFDNLDFNFNQHGLIFESICMATIELPSYQIKGVRTGQWIPDQQRNLWQEEFSTVQ